MLVNNLLLIILFYLIGSLPFALILTKLSGFGDIRNIGSGNVGATNVLRTGNKLLAIIVLSLDILKGLIPYLIIHIYFNELSLLNKIFLCHFAVIGHIYPIYHQNSYRQVLRYVLIYLVQTLKLQQVI